ncbi:MAG: Rrf2 family transcriptional regulator [Armatimonas sp.]
MNLRNQVEWALHCCSTMIDLPDGEYLSTKALAEFHGVPKEYLSKALQSLSQNGVITGILGPSGGYRLARAPEEITFLDIVEAIEGKRSTFQCTEIRQNNPCLLRQSNSSSGPCAVARIMWEADEAWRSRLRSVTLRDLAGTLSVDIPLELLTKSREWLLQH